MSRYLRSPSFVVLVFSGRQTHENVRKVEFHLGDFAQRMCPLIPSSKDFVHKVPHLFFDLVQCNGRRAKKCVESSQQKVVAPGKACPPSDALEGGARRMQVIAKR